MYITRKFAGPTAQGVSDLGWHGDGKSYGVLRPEVCCLLPFDAACYAACCLLSVTAALIEDALRAKHRRPALSFLEFCLLLQFLF